ncbi:hypothetical protein BCU83_18260 [Vibrio breoganii]|uniref:(Na+)-NQR maturation NqrM n=1 Tax=Vibrio breoganii TaxID=553239 RepID=UPI000C8682D6|nr:(Na+)-NQR maturation NqrM [Vibrio breoganii]PMG85575.1 hypothetical protein BCU83_18260 [Vibrio breoganii]
MTVLLSILVFSVAVALMTVGVVFSRKPIKGSCGGLVQLGIERECNCGEVCAEHRRVLYQIDEPS